MFRSEGVLVGFESTGHAGFAEPGQDIVCSAVSALTQTILYGLREIAEVPMGFELSEEDGIYCITDTDATDGERRDADLLLRTMANGLRVIQKEYNGYLKISEREV